MMQSSSEWRIAVGNLDIKPLIDYSKEQRYLKQTLKSPIAISLALQRLYDTEYRKKHRELLALKQRYRYFIKKYGYIPEDYKEDFISLTEGSDHES